MTKGRITTAIESDTTPFMAEIGPLLLGAYEMYEKEPTHEFDKAAYLMHPAFIAEAKELMQSDPGMLLALELIATRVLSRLPDDEVLPAVASVVEAVMDMQNKSGPYARPTAWAREHQGRDRPARVAPRVEQWERSPRGYGGVVEVHGRGGAGAELGRREGALRQEEDLVGPRAGGEEDEDLRHVPARPDPVR